MSVSVVVTLVEHTCWSCGIVYGLPDNYDRQRREQGGEWMCPNGHGSVFKTTEVVKLRKSLQEAQQAAINARTEAEDERKKRVRIEKRARAGTCPMGCKRPFVNLGRHIATKHPEKVAVKK